MFLFVIDSEVFLGLGSWRQLESRFTFYNVDIDYRPLFEKHIPGTAAYIILVDYDRRAFVFLTFITTTIIIIIIMGNKVSLEENLIDLKIVSKQMLRSAQKCEQNEKAAINKLKKVSVNNAPYIS